MDSSSHARMELAEIPQRTRMREPEAPGRARGQGDIPLTAAFRCRVIDESSLCHSMTSPGCAESHRRIERNVVNFHLNRGRRSLRVNVGERQSGPDDAKTDCQGIMFHFNMPARCSACCSCPLNIFRPV